MQREITDEEIIFRNVITQQEGVMKYEDGKWYKPAEVVKETALKTDRRPMQDKHFNGREIGYVTPPKQGKAYKRGRMLRDWHFEKSKLSKEEIEQLLTGKKMEVSTDYKSKDIKVPGTFNMQHYDGINAQMDIDYFVWTDQGRCSEQDGCGLRRTDEADEKLTRRYDSIENECEDCDCEDDNMTQRADQKGAEALKSCVAAKIRTIKKEGGNKKQSEVIAHAMSYCRKKLGIKEPKK